WELMQNWLGVGFVYPTQGEGDLGQRMLRSLVDAFSNNAEQVIIIGTDCPGLNSQILASAFEQLQTSDLVLGPAIDGGYYLIGLQKPILDLFTSISWGTNQVLSQTVTIAQELHLSFVNLPTLADVDRPEDLLVWEQCTLINGH
ncbi:MAG: TIGR04282 family arsenosugar biosynthesis glycosyltransferase, partial [Sphaerospermopsis kisseleviana]